MGGAWVRPVRESRHRLETGTRQAIDQARRQEIDEATVPAEMEDCRSQDQGRCFEISQYFLEREWRRIKESVHEDETVRSQK